MSKRKKAEPEERVPLPVVSGTPQEQLSKIYYGSPEYPDGWQDCRRCKLSDYRFGRKIVYSSGNPQARVMIVGEAPGEDEEQTCVPFTGASGRLLNQILAQTSDDPEILTRFVQYVRSPRTQASTESFHDYYMGKRQQEFFITNVVGCRPPENRTPTPAEVDACSERLRQLIYTVDPWIIIAAGKTALESLLGKKMGIEKTRGQVFDMTLQGRVGKITYPVMATFHPSYLLRKADWGTDGGDFDKTVSDFKKAQQIVDFVRERNFGVPMPKRGC